MLIAIPWLAGFADGSAAMWLPVTVGILSILYSLITNYELGAAKMISIPLHLGLDAFFGLFLAASPWLFGFAETVQLPHVVFGMFEFIMGMITQTSKSPEGTMSFHKGYR